MQISKNEMSRSIITMTNDFIDICQKCNHHLNYEYMVIENMVIENMVIIIHVFIMIVWFSFGRYMEGIMSLFVLLFITGFIVLNNKYDLIEKELHNIRLMMNDEILIGSLRNAILRDELLSHMTYDDLEKITHKLTMASIKITKLCNIIKETKSKRIAMDIIVLSCIFCISGISIIF